MPAKPLRPRAVFVLIVLLSSVGRGSAQHMAEDSLCRTAGPGVDVTRCFIEEGQRTDRELNLLYNQIREILSPADRAQLQAVERLWIQFRDANCGAERDLYGGGSAAPMVYAACVAADTRQRTAELKVMYGWRLEKFGK
jgi:uncharacterized protein YecT (DUF1311 family)